MWQGIPTKSFKRLSFVLEFAEIRNLQKFAEIRNKMRNHMDENENLQTKIEPFGRM